MLKPLKSGLVKMVCQLILKTLKVIGLLLTKLENQKYKV